MGVDFNITMNSEIDKNGGTLNKKSKHVEVLQNFLDTNELQDIWRIRNPETRRYTWRQKSPIIQCRLDYWFITDVLQDYVESVNIIPSIRSDHSAVILQVKSFSDQQRGPNLWKFNSSLLQEKSYIDFITNNIDNWITSEIEDKRVVWEILK